MPIINLVYEAPESHSRLPTEYQEVEYIQSSGTQYIDTGVTPLTTLKTEIKLNSQLISESAILGSRWTLGGYFLMFINNNVRWHSGSAIDVPCSLNTDYTLIAENGQFTVNGNVYTGGTLSLDTNSPVYLFSVSYDLAGRPLGQYKLYYTKMWDGNTLLRDFVPCYRKLDSVIGLYDVVNDVFYTNSGSGTFAKGGDVS